MADFLVFVSEQWMLVSILLLLVYIFIWREKAKGGKSVSTHQAVQLLNSDGAVLVDIRPEGEFKAGHITDAINIPSAKLKERLDELQAHKERVIVLVDKMGQHVGAAGRILSENGFQVRRLDGGMMEWKNQNMPLVKK